LAPATTENPRQYWLCGAHTPQTYAQQGFAAVPLGGSREPAASRSYMPLFINNIFLSAGKIPKNRRDSELSVVGLPEN
jgi:hypothetical protein